MSLSIQTNTDSLMAQENLLTNSIFQSNTIGQLTSGYRINTAGDDPAGLAVANQYASAIAELTQGYANGNDATAQLQIMDGGMSNISHLVNTLQTLATQSASGSFTGNRTTLNNQFQTDLAEINRQAQSIGLNTGGTFAKLMSVYFGAGSGSASQSNGIVNVSLSNATVDAQSLGLSGVQAVNLSATPLTVPNYDLGASSATSVNAVATDAANLAAIPTGSTSFTFTGSGFGDVGNTQNGVKINVNMTGVDDTTSLVTAINSAIQTAAGTAGAANGAFAAAGITASIHTDSSGREQLAFNSATSAFQVTADDLMSNALIGNFNGSPQGAAAPTSMVAGGAYMLGTKGAASNTETDLAFTTITAGDAQQSITISANDASGTAHTLSVTLLTGTTGATATAALNAINNALQSSDDKTLQQITAVVNPGATALNFISNLPNFQVSLGATASGLTGLGTDGTTTIEGTTLTALQVGAGGTADIGTAAGAQAAVTAINAAVSLLGTAQAAVGTGEDQLGFASALAQSQITNFSSAESQIRDANVAQQAANLSKAQVLQQSSIAAMAQANAEPQALLTLLKGA